MFISETGRDNASVGKGLRERETRNLKQAPGSELSAQSPRLGLNPRTVRSRPRPKLDAEHPATPHYPQVTLRKMQNVP